MPILFLLVVALAAVATSMALRRLRVPAAGMAGGIVAGLLFGPTVLGRLAPEWYEQNIVGGRAERLEWVRITREHGANELARGHFNADGTATQHDRQAELEREAVAKHEWSVAKERQARPSKAASAALAVILLLTAGAGRAARTTAPPLNRPDWYPPLSVGLWSAVFPGGLAFILLTLMEAPLTSALAAAAAVAVGPVSLAAADHAAANAAEPGGAAVMRRAALVAIILATAAMSWSIANHAPSGAAWLAAAPVAAIIGWALPRFTSRPVVMLIDRVLVPAVAGAIACRVELFAHLSLWPMLVLPLLSGDGRWIGAFLGAVLCGARKSLRSMRLVLGAMGAARAQLAFACIALGAAVLDEGVAFALLIGAALMDSTSTIRSHIARDLEQAEQELEDIRNDPRV
jgi:hypothetical protein